MWRKPKPKKQNKTEEQSEQLWQSHACSEMSTAVTCKVVTSYSTFPLTSSAPGSGQRWMQCINQSAEFLWLAVERYIWVNCTFEVNQISFFQQIHKMVRFRTLTSRQGYSLQHWCTPSKKFSCYWKENASKKIWSFNNPQAQSIVSSSTCTFHILTFPVCW